MKKLLALIALLPFAALRSRNGLLRSVAMSPRLSTHWEHNPPCGATAPASGLLRQPRYLMLVICASSTPKGSWPPPYAGPCQRAGAALFGAKTARAEQRQGCHDPSKQRS
jgi:hypothetical protein